MLANRLTFEIYHHIADCEFPGLIRSLGSLRSQTYFQLLPLLTQKVTFHGRRSDKPENVCVRRLFSGLKYKINHSCSVPL